MSEDFLSQFSPLERLIASAPGKEIKAMIAQHQENRQKPLISFAFSEKHDAQQLLDSKQLFKALDICKPWIAAYDEKHQVLYQQYYVEISTSDHSINLFATPDMAVNAFKFVSASSLQKTEYFLIPQYDDNKDEFIIGKNRANGEYATFNLTRGLKEFVYSLMTHSPLLPVLCHDSLTMHPQTGGHALRLCMLIIDHLDLHLEHSRKKIFDSMRRNLIDSYKLNLLNQNKA